MKFLRMEGLVISLIGVQCAQQELSSTGLTTFVLSSSLTPLGHYITSLVMACVSHGVASPDTADSMKISAGRNHGVLKLLMLPIGYRVR